MRLGPRKALERPSKGPRNPLATPSEVYPDIDLVFPKKLPEKDRNPGRIQGSVEGLQKKADDDG